MARVFPPQKLHGIYLSYTVNLWPSSLQDMFGGLWMRKLARNRTFSHVILQPMVSKDVLQKGFSTSSMTRLHLPHITDNYHWVLSRSIASSSVVSTLERKRAAKVPIQGVVRPTAPAGVALNWTKEAEKSCWAAFLPLGIVIWLPQMNAKKIRFSNVGRSWDVLLFLEKHETCHFWGQQPLVSTCWGSHSRMCFLN